MSGALLLILTLSGSWFSAVHRSQAQTAGELRIAIADLDTSGFPLVKFVATVTDPAGRTLNSLNPQDFAVSSRSKHIPVASVQSLSDANVGISSLLVIDTSGSMAGAPISAAKDSASLFLSAQRPADEVSLLAFSDTVYVVSGYTSDFDGIRPGLDALVARGNTSLYQAVAQAANDAAGRQAEKKAIILISDGADFGGLSRATRQQSIDAARTAGVPFYIIGLGNDIDRQYLQVLADVSRGRFFYAPDPTQLAALYSEVTQLVRTHYVVTLDFQFTDLEGDIIARTTVSSGARTGTEEFKLSLPITTPQVVEIPPAPAPPQSSFNPVVLAIPLLLAAVGVAVLLFVRRVRTAPVMPSVLPPPVFNASSNFSRADELPRETLAYLRLDGGQSYALGTSIATVGVNPECTVRLDIPEAQFGQGSIRVWRSNGRFVLHDTASRPRVRVNGKPVTWSFLDHGDIIEIRDVRLSLDVIS